MLRVSHSCPDANDANETFSEFASLLQISQVELNIFFNNTPLAYEPFIENVKTVLKYLKKKLGENEHYTTFYFPQEECPEAYSVRLKIILNEAERPVRWIRQYLDRDAKIIKEVEVDYEQYGNNI